MREEGSLRPADPSSSDAGRDAASVQTRMLPREPPKLRSRLKGRYRNTRLKRLSPERRECTQNDPRPAGLLPSTLYRQRAARQAREHSTAVGFSKVSQKAKCRFPWVPTLQVG